MKLKSVKETVHNKVTWYCWEKNHVSSDVNMLVRRMITNKVGHQINDIWAQHIWR